MADDGHVILDAQGRRIMRDDGSLDICQACCGCKYCDTQPMSVSVTISDVTEWPCAYYDDAPYIKVYQSPSVDPNGTFNLVQSNTNKCQWDYEVASTGKVGIFANSSCSGTPSVIWNITKYIVHVGFGASSVFVTSAYDLGGWMVCEHSIVQSPVCQSASEAFARYAFWSGGNVSVEVTT